MAHFLQIQFQTSTEPNSLLKTFLIPHKEQLLNT